jgi:hypothetical protein
LSTIRPPLEILLAGFRVAEAGRRPSGGGAPRGSFASEGNSGEFFGPVGVAGTVVVGWFGDRVAVERPVSSNGRRA